MARERQEEFNLTLTRYGLERILFRISRSPHRDVFVLKGALLLELWTKQTHRPTRDADFLAHGENAPTRFVELFRQVCAETVEDDGLLFDARSVQAEPIKEGADYEGVRVTFAGALDGARIPIQIDIGFGDAVTPGPELAEYPTMLDLPRPKLLAYPKETVIAEKFEAMVKRAFANSRMKDLHDIQTLARSFAFDGEVLSQAVGNTFGRRKTALPASGTVPIVLTDEFCMDATKQKQWHAFVNKNRTYIPAETLEVVMADVRLFLVPPLEALSAGQVFTKHWNPPGPWKDPAS